MSREVIERTPISKLLTSKGFVVGIIWSFFVMVMGYLAYGFSHNRGFFMTNMGDIPPEINWCWLSAELSCWWFAQAVITMIIASLLRMNKRDATIFLSMTIFVLGWSWPVHGMVSALVSGPTGATLWGEPYVGYIIKDVPWIYPMDEAALRAVIRGGMALWGSWLPLVVFTIISCLSLPFMSMCIGGLLQRNWIKNEALPFPIATAMNHVVNLATGEKRKAIFTNKYLWIGALVGILLSIQEVLHFLPGLYSIPFHIPYYDLTPLALLPWVPLVFFYEAQLIGAAFLIPTEALIFGLIVFIVTFIIWPVIATSMGILPTMPTGLNWISPWWNIQFLGIVPGQTMNYWTSTILYSIGFILAVIIWPAIINRRIYLDVFRGLISKGPEAPQVQDAPFSYRTLWLGAIIGFLVFAGSYIAIGGNPVLTLILAALPIVTIIWYGRAHAEMGGIQCSDEWYYWENVTSLAVGSIVPAVMGGVKPGPEAWTPSYMNFVIWRNSQDSQMAVLRWNMEGYKLADLQNVHTRDIFISQFLALAATIIFCVPFYVWLGFTYGWDATYGNGWLQWWTGGYLAQQVSNFLHTGTWIWGRRPATPSDFGPIVVAFIIGIILNYVKSKNPRLPISVATIPVVFMFGPRAFLPWIIALVAKSLILRTGGIRAYEEKGVPFAVGMIAGVGFLMIFDNAVMMQWKLAGLPL